MPDHTQPVTSSDAHLLSPITLGTKCCLAERGLETADPATESESVVRRDGVCSSP